MWLKKLFSKFKGSSFEERYKLFRKILDLDRKSLQEISKIEKIILERKPCDFYFLAKEIEQAYLLVEELVKSLQKLNPEKYKNLHLYLKKIKFYLDLNLKYSLPLPEEPFVLTLREAYNPHLSGGKAASLAKLLDLEAKNFCFSIPQGFVITTSAYALFIKENKLDELIKEELKILDSAQLSKIERVSANISKAIIQSPIPSKIQEKVEEYLNNTASKLAFRSSAYLEDSELSFAGQYSSLLNVSRQKWQDAYKKVLISKYSPQAIFYRLKHHLPDNLTPMAVLVMPMLKATLSGVMYTALPQKPDTLAIHYQGGLGESLVSGKSKGEKIYLNKKENKGTEPWIEKLFQTGLTLEKIFKKALDIEWVLEKEELFLVQVRPFHFTSTQVNYTIDLPLLCKGESITFGSGTGKLFILKDLSQIQQIPSKSILFTKYLYPELTLILDQIEGLITLEGSQASHLSHIAREMQKPIIRVEESSNFFLQAGQEITLDAYKGKVYLGKAVIPKSKSKPSLPTLKKILKHLSSLNLISTQEGFTPQNCQSLHDLIRFCHEMAVREIFTPSPQYSFSSKSKKLKTKLPLTIYLIDLSKKESSSKEIELSQIASPPLQVFLTGLSHPDIPWHQIPPAFDWDKFDQMSAGIFNPKQAPELNSFAFVDKDYLHFLLRFGYHFVLVDSLIGKNSEQNYLQISFKGGGGLETGRLLRLKLLQFLLKNLNFQVESQGDFLKAEIKKRPEKELLLTLKKIGFLLGKSRLLDMSLTYTNYKQCKINLKNELEKIS